MNKYLRAPSRIIDLHGHTTAEAKVVLEELIRSNDDYVRVITGKGNNSVNGPVLRDFVKKFFLSKNIHFNQAKMGDGGEGALDVFL